MDLHTLTKLRAAHKNLDGAEGFLYVHQWPTGFQQVIFENEKTAEAFLKMLNDISNPKEGAYIVPLGEQLSERERCAAGGE